MKPFKPVKAWAIVDSTNEVRGVRMERRHAVQVMRDALIVGKTIHCVVTPIRAKRRKK